MAAKGNSRSRIYRIWAAMRNRCYNTKQINYERYGGRGIQVCERWRKSFVAFYEDMGDPPSEKHSLDRINNDGNYEPGNCRWATAKEQERNKGRHADKYLAMLMRIHKLLSERGGFDDLVIEIGAVMNLDKD